MPTPRAAHAIIFVVDGLRPDALPRTDTPCVDRLAAQGAYTWQAQAPTLAHLLGLAAPVDWHGQVVEEALAA
jgi:predicted AlkP superfamily pyrophosphatase or phosphodiesterase